MITCAIWAAQLMRATVNPAKDPIMIAIGIRRNSLPRTVVRIHAANGLNSLEALDDIVFHTG